MSSALATMLAIAAVTLCVVLLVMGITYSKYRGAWTVECPETEGTAEVKIDVAHAALTSALGPPELRVGKCSRWPQRHDCDQSCIHAA
jgi:hypothetical protein